MQKTLNPENKIELLINKSYQSAYSKILISAINECNYLPDAIKNSKFDDSNMATITNSQNGVVTWSIDLIKVTDNNSKLIFYTAYPAQQKFAHTAQQSINENLKGCVFSSP
jgi:hypothetical protein